MLQLRTLKFHFFTLQIINEILSIYSIVPEWEQPAIELPFTIFTCPINIFFTQHIQRPSVPVGKKNIIDNKIHLIKIGFFITIYNPAIVLNCVYQATLFLLFVIIEIPIEPIMN